MRRRSSPIYINLRFIATNSEATWNSPMPGVKFVATVWSGDGGYRWKVDMICDPNVTKRVNLALGTGFMPEEHRAESMCRDCIQAWVDADEAAVEEQQGESEPESYVELVERISVDGETGERAEPIVSLPTPSTPVPVDVPAQNSDDIPF